MPATGPKRDSISISSPFLSDSRMEGRCAEGNEDLLRLVSGALRAADTPTRRNRTTVHQPDWLPSGAYPFGESRRCFPDRTPPLQIQRVRSTERPSAFC